MDVLCSKRSRNTPKVKTIASWEQVDGESGMHFGAPQLDPAQADELMQQFAALGYIEDPGADKEKAAESAEIEAKYNVARTYLWKGQPDQARPLLEEIVRRRPWEDRFLRQLAPCYFQGGYLAPGGACSLRDRGWRRARHGRRQNCSGREIKLARGDLGGALQCLARGRGDESAIAGYLHPDRRRLCALLQWQKAKVGLRKSDRAGRR